jgi:hypothetical protein
MCVKDLPSLHVVAWGFSTAPGVKAADQAETSLRLARAGTGNIAGKSGAPIPVDPCPLFEAGEITIDRMFHGFLSSNVVATLSGSAVLFCASDSVGLFASVRSGAGFCSLDSSVSPDSRRSNCASISASNFSWTA